MTHEERKEKISELIEDIKHNEGSSWTYIKTNILLYEALYTLNRAEAEKFKR